MEAFYKLAAVLFVFMVVAIICGMITTASESEDDTGNVTPVNDTINHTIIPDPIIPAEQPVDEMTPEEAMAIREGEKAEEDALADDSDGTKDEPVIEEPVIEEVDNMVTEPVVNDETIGTENTDIFIPETADNIPDKGMTLKRIVNRSGFVYVGTEYADKEVTISI